MSADKLLDSNVIIYIVDTRHPEKTRRSEQLVQSGVHKVGLGS